jgi:hypothetical protein
MRSSGGARRRGSSPGHSRHVEEELDGVPVDLSRLPGDLQPLVPLIRRYAASDDVERETRLEAASDDELRELSEAPHGLWDAINRYLDENITSALPYEATVLDSFAQAALEAELELRRRGSAGR